VGVAVAVELGVDVADGVSVAIDVEVANGVDVALGVNVGVGVNRDVGEGTTATRVGVGVEPQPASRRRLTQTRMPLLRS
jgi:hypothetical protein